MNLTSSDFLFRVWPYMAIGLLGLGLLIRCAMLRYRIAAVRRALPGTISSFLGGRALRMGLLLLVAGHLAGLFFPRSILRWNAQLWRLYLLEGVAFLVGILAAASWIRTVGLHLRRPRTHRGSLLLDLGDSMFLSLVFLAIGSGLFTAAFHRWGSSWGVVTLTPYTLSLLRGHPAAMLVDHLPLVVRLHVCASFGALALFPLTRLAPLPILAAVRAFDLLRGPLVAAARPAAAWLRRSGRARLWPEPEYRWVAKPHPTGDPGPRRSTVSGQPVPSENQAVI